MKKILICLLSLTVIFFVILFTVFKKEKDNNGLEKVKLAEVTHSIFYTPLYVAIENGYFKEEGIDLELILTSGADKVSAAVLSNDVNIGFAGPESAIYVYNNGEEDYLITFAGLTKRDGQFIVAREKDDSFSMEKLYDKEILVGRKGGMPMLNFTNGVYNQNANLDRINMNTAIDFAALTGTFISGVGDYVNLFEPNATKLEQQGLGYVVASVGNYSGEMPYTAFYARKSYIDKNQDIVKAFNRAINKGIKFVEDNTDEKVAEVIYKQFADLSLNDITAIVKRYRDADSWLSNTTITQETYKNLEDIMIKNSLLDEYVDFNTLVVNLNE